MVSRRMRPFTLTAVDLGESDVVTVTSPEIQTCIVGAWRYTAMPGSIVAMSTSVRRIVRG